ncbi:hypothetical protein L1049_012424 [Liquidambar formosana]|uniref:Peptidase A1 domain-containing protein n=1 Tax=Liquidambar formosana TaxID=63359 RepID=A0AAP0R2I3_LIQFO
MEKRMMKKGKVSVVALFVLLLVSCSYASDDRPHKRRKSIPPSKALALNRVGSSVVFPMLGNVYPKGFYHVTLFVGQPPKPYFLDPDTGSDLTWLQCDAPCVHCTKAPHPPYKPSNDLVICKDPLCSSLHPPGHHDCKDPEQCDYFVEYADGSSSLGVLLRDVVPVNLTNGVQVRPRLAIGCGYDQVPGKYNYHPIDGVLGLGKGKSTIVSQLYNQGVVQNVLGHCLNSRGGFLFFGDDLYDSSRVVWTPMLSDDSYKHYSPGFAELTLGGKTTGFKNLRVIFDTGSTYTYLDSLAYQALISWVNGELAGKPLKEDRVMLSHSAGKAENLSKIFAMSKNTSSP